VSFFICLSLLIPEKVLDFEITQVLLIEEAVMPENYPTPASGVTREIFESLQNGRIFWLAKPLRNTAETRYTGPMEHPASTGQLAHTLSAFVHLAFQTVVVKSCLLISKAFLLSIALIRISSSSFYRVLR
jgi:hypothetical protein